MIWFKNKWIDKIFNIIPLGIITNMFLSWKYLNYYTPDSYNYIRLSKDLPNIKDSVFPLFLPIILWFVEFFTKNYDLTFKIINLFSVIFILSFVRIKNFFWKEVWVMMTFSALQNIYPMAWSENILLVFIILYCYYNYNFLKGRINENKFLFYNTLLLLAMLFIKYNSVFILFSCFLFALLIRKRNIIFSKNYLLSAIISLSIFLGYLMFNFYHTGNLTGVRGGGINFNYLSFLFHSLVNVPLVIDPLSFSLHRIAVKIKLEYEIFYITLVPYVLSYLLNLLFIYFYFKQKNKNFDVFTFFCLLSSLIFIVCNFIAAFTTKIDVLDFRLLMFYYIFLLIGVVNSLKINLKISNYDHKLLIIGIFSIVSFCFSLIF
ncbi:hypothetical protein [Cloacibacterium sp. TD35]|uniref:hypothetical protein n=1 Tax=Cloacibacterium sp. TD35 TaxID=2976818 RepID=UPI00237E5299|nr:hypothetical protein [Cloacibacterium sp. TD35]WDT68129.1 hypothetical protein N7277_00565 [Cloacibacterium sp. TD35]